jgi:N-acyl-D-aspartate/D-glutamate deacylase
VTWTNLLANKEAQKHKTSKKELDNMRALIARDLADAGIAGLSADRRFAMLTTQHSRPPTWRLPVRDIGS